MRNAQVRILLSQLSARSLPRVRTILAVSSPHTTDARVRRITANTHRKVNMPDNMTFDQYLEAIRTLCRSDEHRSKLNTLPVAFTY